MSAKRMPLVAAAVWWLRSARPRVKPLSAHLLVDLVEYCDTAGTCYPAVATIGENLGADRRSVQRALGALLRHPDSPIVREIRPHHSTPVYRVTEALLRIAEGRHGRRVSGDASRETRQETTGGASQVTGRGVTGVTPIDEPPREPPTDPPRSPRRARVLHGAAPKGWSNDACADWIERFGGTAPGGAIGKALSPLVVTNGWQAVRAAWRSYLAQAEADYVSAARFAATYGKWSGDAPDPVPSSAKAQQRENAMSAMALGGLRSDGADAWIQSRGGREALVAEVLAADRPHEDGRVLHELGAPPAVLRELGQALYYARKQRAAGA